MKQEKKRDIWSALLVFLLGSAITIGSFNYSIGTLTEMGPGYFPLILGVVLTILSFVIFFSSEDRLIIIKNKKSKGSSNNRLRAWVFIVLSMLSFVVLSIYVGLLASTFSLVFIAALADKKNSIKSNLYLSAGLAVFVILVFHYFLKIQIPLWVN